LNRIPPTRKFLSEVGPKPLPCYKNGFMHSKDGGINKAMAGLMLPQPQVITQQGNHLLLDDLLGTGFAILRLHQDPAQAFAPLVPHIDIWKHLGTRFICVQPNPNPVTIRRGESGREGLGGPLWSPAGVASIMDQQSTIDSVDGGVSPLVIQSSELCTFLQNRHDIFVLVRPDRYIYGVFKEENAEAFISSLRRYLTHTVK
jgi:3-(3-hydroxy-phenyl)propionate hydroxylase